MAALALGCSSSETSAPQEPEPKYPTETSFCTALAEAECGASVVEACYGASDPTTLTSSTRSCVDARNRAELCRTIPGYESADTRSAPYHPEAAEACVESRRSTYEDAALSRAEIEASGKACLGVFSGDRKAGDSCKTDVDCDASGGLACVTKAGKSMGVCATPREIAGGDSCAAEADVCKAGYYCGAENACIAENTAGEACAVDKPCAEGLLCSGPEGSAACREKTPNGGDCTADEECAGTFCAIPSGGAQGDCSSTLTLAATSASCNPFKP